MGDAGYGSSGEPARAWDCCDDSPAAAMLRLPTGAAAGAAVFKRLLLMRCLLWPSQPDVRVAAAVGAVLLVLVPLQSGALPRWEQTQPSHSSICALSPPQ